METNLQPKLAKLILIWQTKKLSEAYSYHITQNILQKQKQRNET